MSLLVPPRIVAVPPISLRMDSGASLRSLQHHALLMHRSHEQHHPLCPSQTWMPARLPSVPTVSPSCIGAKEHDQLHRGRPGQYRRVHRGRPGQYRRVHRGRPGQYRRVHRGRPGQYRRVHRGRPGRPGLICKPCHGHPAHLVPHVLRALSHTPLSARCRYSITT